MQGQATNVIDNACDESEPTKEHNGNLNELSAKNNINANAVDPTHVCPNENLTAMDSKDIHDNKNSELDTKTNHNDNIKQIDDNIKQIDDNIKQIDDNANDDLKDRTALEYLNDKGTSKAMAANDLEVYPPSKDSATRQDITESNLAEGNQDFKPESHKASCSGEVDSNVSEDITEQYSTDNLQYTCKGSDYISERVVVTTRSLQTYGPGPNKKDLEYNSQTLKLKDAQNEPEKIASNTRHVQLNSEASKDSSRDEQYSTAQGSHSKGTGSYENNREVKYNPDELQYTPHDSQYIHEEPQYTPEVSQYTPEGSQYITHDSKYIHEKPQFTPEEIQYTPHDSKYKHEEPQYTPEVSQYTPEVSQYTPEGSQYTIHDSKYIHEEPQFTPEELQYTPAGLQYTPEGLQYTPEGLQNTLEGLQYIYEEYNSDLRRGEAFVRRCSTLPCIREELDEFRNSAHVLVAKFREF